MKTRGTIAPTSKYTSKKMLKNIEFDKADFIVELGAGDGSITEHILDQMHPNAKLISFEIDSSLCIAINEKIDDSRLRVINDSAEHIENYLKEFDVSKVDYVVSGIPFVMLPDELGDKILELSKGILKPAGRFIQFHYSTIPKKRYERIFDEVDIKLEVRNLPPAFVFICK